MRQHADLTFKFSLFRRNRARKSGRPSLFEPSLKVQRDFAHKPIQVEVLPRWYDPQHTEVPPKVLNVPARNQPRPPMRWQQSVRTLPSPRLKPSPAAFLESCRAIAASRRCKPAALGCSCGSGFMGPRRPITFQPAHGSLPWAGFSADHENKKVPISKPAANAQSPSVHAEMRRARIWKSSSEKLSCNRCVMVPRGFPSPASAPGPLKVCPESGPKEGNSALTGRTSPEEP